MDIYDFRHANLMALVNGYLERGLRMKEIAQALGGMNSSHLSQLKAGKRIGDEVARKIEAAVGLKPGSMDMPRARSGEEQHRSAHKVEEQASYYITEEVPLTPRELALLRNYRAADERTKNVVDAAASAAAQPRTVKAKKEA